MQTLNAATRTVTRCIVCGFAEVRTDEVVDRGLVVLSECPRCDHRATWRIPAYEPAQVSWPERPAARAVAARGEEAEAA
jgi:hypothetical protein